jgi:TolB-like protein/thioredoxin-like negative regulator of GroEL
MLEGATQAFISYASADSAIANAVCTALEREGVKCWIAPRDVSPGEFYAANIVHAIDETRLVVLVLSQHAADSAHVLREVERASAKRHPILSFRIDLTPLPDGLEYFLNTSQWLDASAAGVDRTLPRLVDAVKAVLAKSTAAPPVAPTASATPRANRQTRHVLGALAALAAIVLAYLAIDRLWMSDRVGAQESSAGVNSSAPTSPDNSIAVLPFSDLSENKDQEYFSDGLSEELIDHLAQNAELKVVARSSSFAFKGRNEDVRAIATTLGVTNLLQGSVRKAGDRLRITAQLIRATDGVLLWSETYDRKLDDIFKTQDEISAMVAKALDATLNSAPGTGTPPASKQTANIAAYNLMLQGNYYYWRGNKGDEAKAVDFFRQALEADPQYAQAWAKLARVFVWQGLIGDLASDEAIVKSRDAVERALAIDPNCAEAYYARGNMHRLLAGDWAPSLSDYERALALDPNGEVGVSAQGNLLQIKASMNGRVGDLIDFYKRELERNPLDTNGLYELALHQQYAGQPEDSAVTFRRLLDVNPSYLGARAGYSMTLLLMGKHTEALAMAEQEPDEASRLAALSMIHWSLDRRAESDRALRTLEKSAADRKAYEIAGVYAFRGEADAAFAWLDRAFQQRMGVIGQLKIDPLLQKLRGDPRFDALLRKAKLAG